MDVFPGYKRIFVILTGNTICRPLAVTLFADYTSEVIYNSLVTELSRQSKDFHSFDLYYKNPSLIVQGMTYKAQDFMYEMFEDGTTYIVDINDEEED